MLNSRKKKAMVEGLTVKVRLIKKHKPKDARSIIEIC